MVTISIDDTFPFHVKSPLQEKSSWQPTELDLRYAFKANDTVFLDRIIDSIDVDTWTFEFMDEMLLILRDQPKHEIWERCWSSLCERFPFTFPPLSLTKKVHPRARTMRIGSWKELIPVAIEFGHSGIIALALRHGSRYRITVQDLVNALCYPIRTISTMCQHGKFERFRDSDAYELMNDIAQHKSPEEADLLLAILSKRDKRFAI